MKFGMPTLIELESLKENIELCKKLGLDFIEINLNLPQYQVDRLNAEELTECMEKDDMYFTFHLPEDLEIAHFNKTIRTAHWRAVFQAVEFMKEAKISLMNMHMSTGIYFTLPTEKVYLYKKYNSEYRQLHKEFIEELCKRIQQTPIKLAIENTGIYDNEFITTTIDTLLEYDEVVLTFDVGHDYSNGHTDTGFIDANIEKLKHMHLHDAIGTKNHMVLWEGEMELGKCIHLADSSDLSVVIETKTVDGLTKSVRRLKEKGYM